MAPVISIIIPCFNERESLIPLHDALRRVSESMTEAYGVGFEFLFVDDGSRDDTLILIKELADKDDRVRYVSFSRNFGKEAAIYAGLENYAGDFAVVMDADLQHPPAMLPEMYESIVNEGFDRVAARRQSREGESVARSFFARRFYAIINRISKTEMVDGATDFAMMTRQVADAILAMTERNRYYKGIYSWVGFKTKWLPYTNVERAYGSTKWSFWGLLRYAVEGIISFSTAPLAIASVMGVFFSILSVLIIAYVVIRALLYGDPVAGFPALISAICLIGGIQLLCLGIIGQYLTKTYLEVKRRPIYLIKESKLSDKPTRSAE